MSTVVDLQILAQADTNGDGRVSRHELVQALKKAGMKQSQALTHAADFTKSFDKYQTGSVELKEFISEYTRMACFQVIRLLSKKGAGNDDSLDRKSLEDALSQRIGAAAASEVVQRIFDEVDADGSGNLDASELKKWYKGESSKIKARMKANLEATAKEGFAKWDADGSGFIDMEELRYLCSSLGQTLDNEELKEAMSVLDTSGDGKLSFEEFYEWMKSDNKRTNTKTKRQIGLLKSKLLLGRGKTWARNKLETMNTDKTDSQLVLTAKVGEFKDAKATVKLRYSNEHAVDQGVIDSLKESYGQANAFLTMEFKIKPGDDVKEIYGGALSYFRDILSMTEAEVAVQASFPTDAKESDIMRMTWGAEWDEQEDMMGEFGPYLQLLEGLAVDVSTGWNLTELADRATEFTFADLCKLAIEIHVNGIPDEMLMMAGEGGLAAAQESPFAGEDIPILGELKNGTSSGEVEGQFLPLIDKFIEENLNPEASDNLGVEDVRTYPVAKFYQKVNCPEGLENAIEGPEGDEEFVAALMAFKSFLLFLQRDILELKAVHVRANDGKGFSVELENFFSPRGLLVILERMFFQEGIPRRCPSCYQNYFPTHMVRCETKKCNHRMCKDCAEDKTVCGDCPY